MWAADYRNKGAAAIGASKPGEYGPFGRYGSDEPEEPLATGGVVTGFQSVEGRGCMAEVWEDETLPANLRVALRTMGKRGRVVELHGLDRLTGGHEEAASEDAPPAA